MSEILIVTNTHPNFPAKARGRAVRVEVKS